MTALQIANRAFEATEIVSLLTQYHLIPQLLREAMIDQAIHEIHCTPEEVTQACEETYQCWQLQTDVEQQEWRSRHVLSQADFEQLATRSLKIEKFKQVTWGSKLSSYFLQRKAQLDCVLFSLIRLKNRGVANELFFRIQEGEQSFGELAQQYSQGSEVHTGGLYGPVSLGSLSPELADLLYTSAIGVVQPPVSIKEWQVIVRVEKLIPAQLDEPMRQHLLREQLELWVQEHLATLSESDQIWLKVQPPRHVVRGNGQREEL